MKDHAPTSPDSSPDRPTPPIRLGSDTVPLAACTCPPAETSRAAVSPFVPLFVLQERWRHPACSVRRLSVTAAMLVFVTDGDDDELPHRQLRRAHLLRETAAGIPARRAIRPDRVGTAVSSQSRLHGCPKSPARVTHRAPDRDGSESWRVGVHRPSQRCLTTAMCCRAARTSRSPTTKHLAPAKRRREFQLFRSGSSSSRASASPVEGIAVISA
jgi:hypothetical protein